MVNQRFSEQMRAFDRWKTDLREAVVRYGAWLEANGMSSDEDAQRLAGILDALRGDRLTIAFVAEFARGKTELINAIFFSDYDRRLLPSEAGRTTMCPTELFWDGEAGSAYIRLLPIETRLEESGIAELKQRPDRWREIPLDTDSPEAMATAFREVARTRSVGLAEARDLGLYRENDRPLAPDGTTSDRIEIPMWRHALISFPHPLLKQGLVILDTPGLNALGCEPELTMSLLPGAQAVLFVLSADTGVTRSDMEMWMHNVEPLHKETGVLVVLNKVDVLWDELKGEEAVARSVEDQCRKVSQTLGVDPGQVFPASAQKGLLARIRHDRALLERSRIPALESVLAHQILPFKQGLVRRYVVAGIGSMVKESQDQIASRLASATRQLLELRDLNGKNNEVVDHLMKQSREEQVAYFRNVESFLANKRILAEQSRRLQELLDPSALERLMAEARRNMNESLTTQGLRRGMKSFFDGVAERMGEVADYAEQINRLVVTVYHKFHQEHGIAEIKPLLFSASHYAREFDRLQAEAEAFRNSPVTTMTEQHYVVRKFIITLASHARDIFVRANREAEQWSRAVMNPLMKQIKDHKDQMERRLENLRKIHESCDTLQFRIEEMEKNVSLLQRQYGEIREMLTAVNRPLQSAPEEPAGVEAA